MEPASSAPGARLVKVKGPGPVPVCLRVNDRLYCLPLEPRCSLLDALRQHLGLTGAKRVCNMGECGACTVLLDGRPINACITLAVECDGRSITTIEGIATDGHLDPLQEAFILCDAVQCGFCTPGQIMAARALLARNPNPSEEQIRRAMAGNLCRCGTYNQIVQAVRRACQDSDVPSAGRSRPDAVARRGR